MPFHANAQQRLVTEGRYSPTEAFTSSIVTRAPWDSIIDFATHDSFCGMTLYPRQQTLLRLIFLETDQMTQYDLDVIEEWRHGFMQRRDIFGVQPDIWERVAYLKERGFRRFPEVQAVLGRRASKGMIGGVLGAEQMAYMFSLDDWQAHYGVVPGKDGYLTVVATSQSQAKRHQFRDIAMVVEGCAYLQPHIASSRDCELSIRTPADMRRIASLRAAGMVPDHEIASLHAIAMASNSDVVRGAASFGLFLDEFAFMIQGTGSSKSGEEVYECLDPNTRVLCADLIWRPIGELEVGDKVIGYDEYPDRQGGRRKLRETTVLGVRHQSPSPAYRITFVDGTSVVCSSNHRWLRVNYIAKQGGHNGARWAAIDPVHMPGKRTTRPLKVGDHIKFLVEPWETDNTHDGGWLAGMYDGEGCLSTSGPGRRIHLSQTEGAVLDRAQQVLKDFGFDIHLRSGNYKNRPAHWRPVWSVDINRLEQCMRLLGQFRPTRLLEKQKLLWEGRAISNAQNVKTIACIEQVPDQVLVDIETGTGTFVAEGLLSHNSAVPSLDQFDPDSLIYIPSSPFCLAPETPVLTNDLRWVPVGSLRLGDKLIGFDEDIPGGIGSYRAWREAEVTETTIIQAPRYEITLESGKKILATADHMWLAKRGQGGGKGSGPRGQRSKKYPQNWCWIKVKDLKPGDSIKSIGADPWEADDTREGGWLAGIFDGEGHLSGRAGGQSILGFAQNPGIVLDKTVQLLEEKGFDFTQHFSENRIIKMTLGGGVAEIMRFLGTIRPERLLDKFGDFFYGRRIYGHLDKAADRVVSVELKDHGPVVALGTSTNTLVAEGLLSHNSKIGQFFTLYKQGSVLMKSYTDKHGDTYRRETEDSLGVDAAAAITDMTADPMKLVFQGPSWILYQDWERGEELVGVSFKRPIQPDLTNESQQRRMLRNPEKFRVERMGQFAEVQDQYLDPDKVEAMFAPLDWREPLVAQSHGRFDRTYRIHCDPGRTGANFAMAIGHVEDAPCTGCGWRTEDGGTGWANTKHICPNNGHVWPHVIIDFLHVWKPGDFPPDPESGRRTIDYVTVGQDIKDILSRFRSTEKISMDQWNSAFFLSDLRKEFSPTIRVTEVTFTEKENQRRYEKFKSAINLGWVSSYRDTFFEDNTSLLEQELKFLSIKNGKVVKQDFGPVTTKDLSDCVEVVTVDLLHDALDRWEAGTLTAASYGSTDTAGLRSGREYERGAIAGKSSGRAWQDLERQRVDRARARRYSPSRASQIRTRGMR